MIQAVYLRLNEILAVQIPVTPHSLVQVLLLFQFGFCLCNLLLVVKDLHLSHFHILHVLQHLKEG